MKAGITRTATPVREVILEDVSIYFTAPLVYLIYKMNTISEHYRNSCVNGVCQFIINTQNIRWHIRIHHED